MTRRRLAIAAGRRSFFNGLSACGVRTMCGTGEKNDAASVAHVEKNATFALQRFPEARRTAPTEGIKWESGENPEQFPLLYVPAPPDGADVHDTLLPLTQGSGRRRGRNESEDLPLRFLRFLAMT